jgi:hypothetical protein
MITYKMLHPITPTSAISSRMAVAEATNCHCGLIRGSSHKKIIGCGTLCTTKGFYYKDPKYGTYSSVYLCPKCAKKVGK